MAKLIWDEIGERFYETGTSKGVLYPVKDKEQGGFTGGVVWNGLASVTESPSGAESNPVYADNIKYLDLTSAEDLGAGIEAFYYPDEFAECDGSAEIAPGIMITQQTRKQFGLSYQTVLGNDEENNEHGYKLHLLYNAKASPTEKAYGTINESPEPITFSWELTTTPVNVPGHKPTALVVIDSTKVPAEFLTALEEILYGTEEKEPRLPYPAEVIALAESTSAQG